MKSSRETVERLAKLKKSLFSFRKRKIIEESIYKIVSMQEEIDSLWDMLDEIKKSDIKNYRQILEAKIANSVVNAVQQKTRKK